MPTARHPCTRGYTLGRKSLAPTTERPPDRYGRSRPSPAARLYLSVGLVAGIIVRDRHRACSRWGAGRISALVVSPRDSFFGLTSAVMCVGKSWSERHWRAPSRRAGLGPLMVVCNRCPADLPVQRHLPWSPDDAEVAAALPTSLLYFLPFLAGALYLGAWSSWKHAKTFNRDVYFADLVGRACAGSPCCSPCISTGPTTHHGAADPVAGRRHPVVRGAGRPARRAGHHRRRGGCRPPLHLAPACSASPSSRCPGLGVMRPACPQVPGQPAHLTSAPRRSVTSRSIRSAFRPWAVGLSDNAAFNSGRRCRPTPVSACASIWRRPSGHPAGPAGRRDGLFRGILPMCAPVPS